MNFVFLDKDRFESLKENGVLFLDTFNPSEFKINDYVTFIGLNLSYTSDENKLKAKVMGRSKVEHHYEIYFRI